MTIIDPDALRRPCDPRVFAFTTTEEVPPAEDGIGQERGLEAVDFGLRMTGRGYNLFVTGALGTGKQTMLQQRLSAAATERPTPADWVYLFNFADSSRPLRAELPSGRGRELATAMEHFVEDARKEIPRAFESSNYQQRRREIEEELERQRDAGLSKVRHLAQEQGYALEVTPAGVAMVPIADGQPISREQFEGLTDEEKRSREQARHVIEQRMTDFMATVRGLRARDPGADPGAGPGGRALRGRPPGR